MIKTRAKYIKIIAQGLKEEVECWLEDIDDQFYRIIMHDLENIISLVDAILEELEKPICEIDYDEIRKAYMAAKNKYRREIIWRYVTVGPPDEAD